MFSPALFNLLFNDYDIAPEVLAFSF